MKCRRGGKKPGADDNQNTVEEEGMKRAHRQKGIAGIKTTEDVCCVVLCCVTLTMHFYII